MSIPFFNSVLAALGKRVNYEAVVNYAGNSFAKDSWSMIQEANPMIKKPDRRQTSFVDFLNAEAMKKTKKKKNPVGDISWAT